MDGTWWTLGVVAALAAVGIVKQRTTGLQQVVMPQPGPGRFQYTIEPALGRGEDKWHVRDSRTGRVITNVPLSYADASAYVVEHWDETG